MEKLASPDFSRKTDPHEKKETQVTGKVSPKGC